MTPDKKDIEYIICKNCIMDTSDPEITFDEDGLCSHCRRYEGNKKMFVLSAEEKSRLLQDMIDYCRKKGKGKKYDS